MEGSVVCPVCTLYLRPGMTLKSHLESHPKQKVIDALVKLHSEPASAPVEPEVQAAYEAQNVQAPTEHQAPQTEAGMPWTGHATTSSANYISAQGFPAMQAPVVPAAPAGNHSFFYQQIIGSSGPGAQSQGGYLIPVFNQQMQQMPGYMYHQQQMFVSSGMPAGGVFPSRMLPIEQGESQAVCEYKGPHIVEIQESEMRDNPELIIFEEPEKDDAEECAMPELKLQVGSAKIEVTDTQIVCREVVESAKEKDDFPEAPVLRAELPDAEDEVEEKLKDGDEELMTALSGGDAGGMSMLLVNDFAGGNAHLEVAEECASIDSAHMRADENMPQESNSNASWSRAQFHEGSSRMSTYDLLARESWEGSDVSDVEHDAPPPYQSHYPLYDDDEDEILISSTSRQGISYTCSSCPESFVCPKERRVHQAEVHGAASAGAAPPPAQNVIGDALYAKKVKKLVIKPKAQCKVEILDHKQFKIEKVEKVEKVEPSFDQIFTNIMKVEDERLLNCEGAQDPLKIDAKEAAETASLALAKEAARVGQEAANVIICVLCCGVVTAQRTLRQHEVDAHGYAADVKYKCGVCSEGFSSEPAYAEHLVEHPLECLFCGKYFSRAHNMRLHIKRHLGIKPFRCETCDKHFLTRQKLQEHQYVHTGQAPLKCPYCDETFKRYSNLIQHRNRRHLQLKRKQKDFICATCGDIFHSKKKLAWHRETHENRPKACLHCSEKFVHQASLTRHVRRAHNERFVPAEGREDENVECPICKGVYLRGSLDTHLKSHGGRKAFACNVCDKEFSTKWNLKLHKWTHAGRAQKPFKCELCKGAFVRETDYTAHMNSHRAIRPYTCNHCGAQFIRKYNCQRHVKEHERTKTFNCTVCGKKFHRSYYLNDHMRIHSGVRPFSCHICGKTSTTKSNHNKHVRIHHAREPVSTEN